LKAKCNLNKRLKYYKRMDLSECFSSINSNSAVGKFYDLYFLNLFFKFLMLMLQLIFELK
jgi:hypothetical protein